MKHGASLETSLQPSLHCLHQLFRPLVADTSTWLHAYYMQSPGNHVAGHVYIPKCYNIACDTMFVRSARNNCILKCDTHIHTNYVRDATWNYLPNAKALGNKVLDYLLAAYSVVLT